MTTFPLNSSIEQVTAFRSLTNGGAGVIARGLICKRITSANDAVDIATATTDTFAGLATEDMAVGMTRSVQKSERGIGIAGAAIAINDKLTTDGQGRCVPTTAAGKALIGTAVEAQATVGQPVALEIEFGRFIVAT